MSYVVPVVTAPLLLPGDLIFIREGIHMWQYADMDGNHGGSGNRSMTLLNRYGSILGSHDDHPDWYNVLLFEPVEILNTTLIPGTHHAMNGWIYLSIARFSMGMFDVLTENGPKPRTPEVYYPG